MNGWIKFLIVSAAIVSLAGQSTEVWGAVTADELLRIENAAPEKATAEPAGPRRLLVFNLCKGFEHSSIPYWDEALRIMGRKTGAYEAVISNDMSVFEPNSLKRFDAVCFNNTTRLGFEDPRLRRSLMDFVKGGKGVVGIHAATDNFYKWPEAAEMMGGVFDSHPWTADGIWAVKIEDEDHKLTAAFRGEGFKVHDEIYLIKQRKLRENCRVLLSLDFSDEATAKAAPNVTDAAVAWVRSFGEGRVFYCSLGHNHPITWDKAILQHYLDGIQFALGDLPVDTSPTGPVQVTAQVDELLEDITNYDWGRSRLPITRLNELVKRYYGRPEQLKEVEKKLDEFLGGSATCAAKQQICRILSIIGTEQSVPILSDMLVDAETCDMARYALERIPGSAVDEALRQALPRTDGAVKVGIINTLGMREDAGSVGALKPLIYNSDAAVAGAAISALGRIGGTEAADALAEAKGKVSGALKEQLLQAYLECADSLAEAGSKQKALQMYEEMYAASMPQIIRIGALRGMVQTAEDPGVIVLGAMKSGEPALRTAAVGLVRRLPEGTDIKSIAAGMSELGPDGQVQLLSAFGDRGDKAVLEEVLDATDSEDASVRAAALEAVGALGGASEVVLLAEAAAQSEGVVRQAARDSLYRLRGPEVNGRIVQAIDSASEPVKLELIRSLGERGATEQLAAVMKTARSEDSDVRRVSYPVLRDIAQPDDLPSLIELLASAAAESERVQLVAVVSAVANKIEDRNDRAGTVLAVLKETDEVEVRCSLLQVLGQIQDDSALKVLQSAVESDNTRVRDVAIRALCDWPTAKPAEVLMKVARTADERTHRVLALRGFVRMVAADESIEPVEKVELLHNAMELAADTGAKRMVLSGLSEVGSVEALQIAAGYLDDEQIRQEAAAAAVKIAASACRVDPSATEVVLQQVLKTTDNETIRAQAQEVLKEIERFGDYLVGWQVAGPYSREDAGPDELFDIAFAPEKADVEARWRAVPAGAHETMPWMIDLDEFLGGINRVAYLRTRVYTPKPQDAVLEMGTDDGVKVWLNGEVVHSNNVTRALMPGQDKVEVSLKQGWNDLMLKVTQGGGDWGVCARLRSADGAKLEGLKVSPQ